MSDNSYNILQGKLGENNADIRKNAEGANGVSPISASVVLRRSRLDDSGNDSGHNSIMTSKGKPKLIRNIYGLFYKKRFKRKLHMANRVKPAKQFRIS